MLIEHYKKKYIQYLLIQGALNRDFSALGKNNANVRGFSIKCIFDFERALKVIGWERNNQNLYVSCSKLREIPQFTFNPKNRSSETNPWYQNEYSDLVTEHDLFFDFDKSEEDSWEDLIEEVKTLKEYLDDYSVPYYLIFSGNKGFQIVIDGKYLEIEKIENGNVFPHKTIVEKIKESLGLKFLDLANNGVNSRLRKLPYSLVGEKVALPLSDEQFNCFRVNDMLVGEVLRKVKLIRRGNLERGGTAEDVKTFIKLFDI